MNTDAATPSPSALAALAGIPTAAHVGDEDCPWVDIGDGSLLKVVLVKRSEGLWVVRNRFRPGATVPRHRHTGQVLAVTLAGAWRYAEYPEVNRPGSFLFEPAGSEHTLTVPGDNTDITDVWFAVWGANLNLDADGRVESVYDAQTVLEFYLAMVEAEGGSARVLVMD